MKASTEYAVLTGGACATVPAPVRDPGTDGAVKSSIRPVRRVAAATLTALALTGCSPSEAGLASPLAPEHAAREMMTGDPVRDELVATATNHPDLYRLLGPEDGCIEAVQQLHAAVGEVLSASTAMLANTTAHSAKVHWVAEHYGYDWHDKLVLAHDNTTLRGAVLVDDKDKSTGRTTPMWQHIVFDRNYDQDTPGPRIHDRSAAAPDTIAATVESRTHQLAAG
ncbi:hypothetical protein LQU92_01525 [Kocuria sp. LUK]|uniref:5' nucleotidase, NT5C type n=1 Tax=Kocuria sp. LUK TaxID=2897828 RepID=UPI001E2A852E|nr:hypothetical protein [Kocuria sp. LUK]MCD1143923.1 hypothetical protein [Kocuria sp. LUK]